MQQCKYAIVGGGMAAAAAVKGIRQVDGDGSIVLVGAEGVPPYDRPPLSKGLWTGAAASGDIWRDLGDDGPELVLGQRVTSLRPGDHEMEDERGNVYAYERVLIATGGTPRTLPFGSGDILDFRTYADYCLLRELAEKKHRFLVIGGGFIGSEIAAALAMQDREVTMVFPEAAICGLAFPADLAGFLNVHYEQKGVRVCAGTTATGIMTADGGYGVSLDNGETVTVDVVVAGIGITPNTAIAEEAGLTVDNGILVDSGLLSTAPDVYAAGDVANFYNPALRERVRVEHEDNANTMGELAGRAMAGENVTYDHLPMFYSDMFDLGYEAVGKVDAHLQIVEHWAEPHAKGILFYLRDSRVCGVAFWNVWDQVDAGRELIARQDSVDKDALDAWARERISGG